MPVFQVTLKGSGLRASFSDDEILCGFFKNEFVWAKNRQAAVGKARTNVLTALRRRRTVNQADIPRLEISVEEVQTCGFLSLLRSPGFVFHPLDTHDQ